MREEILKSKGRLMGVDFGDKRTGVAVSDGTRFLSSAEKTVSVSGLKDCAEKLAAEAERLGVCGIIVGLPVNMDGTQGSRAQRCRYLGETLEEMTGLPVDFCDERMTTMEASRYLGETGTFGKKRKQVIDALSAQIILQSYLDKLKNLQK